MYRFNRPVELEDLVRLANLFGASEEMQRNNMLLRAKRLAEVYCNRPRPGIFLYKQHLEWILESMFLAA